MAGTKTKKARASKPSTQKAAPLIQVSLYDSSQQLMPSDAEQIVYFLADLRPPPSTNQEQTLPLNLTFVLDRSTSMRGARLNKVKAASNLIIDKLTPEDIISVISYSDRAEIVVPSSNVKEKSQLMSKVRSINASGGTEIYQGLSAGINQIRKQPLDKFINHVILLTDGHTYGDIDLCLELARESAAQGIGISAFGIGSEWNDRFLDELVTASGGQSGFISEPEQIIHFMRQRIQGLGAIYAQNVKLKLQFPSGIRIKDAFKLTPFAQPISVTSSELQLGSIEGRTSLSVLIELVIDPVPSGRIVSFPIDIEAELPAQDNRKVAIKQARDLIIDRKSTRKRMPDLLIRAVQMLNLYRMNELAWKEVESGDVSAATKRMEMLTLRFKEAGLTQLAQHVRSETQRLSMGDDFSAQGRMQIKYGTRAQLTSNLQIALDNKNSERPDR